jgi:uncharacterized coiled-coil protein SlyX
MKLKLPKYFNQTEYKDKLGTSTVYTIASHGCLISCVSAVCAYHGKDTDPARLNQELKRVKGYQDACNLIYAKVTEIYPDINFDWDIWERGECSSTPAPLSLIDEILESKRVPIIKVDYNPTTSKVDQHWVCIIGKDEAGSYLIYDPIDGTEQYFQARYGDPSRYIFRIICYSGKINEEADLEDKIREMEMKIQSLNDLLSKSIDEGNETKKQLLLQEADNADLIKQKMEITKERDQERTRASLLEGQVASTEKELKTVNTRLDDQLLETERLRKLLTASLASKMKEFSLFQLLKLKFSKEVVENV